MTSFDKVKPGQIYSVEQALKLLQEPHRLGWLCGKTKLTPLHSRWIKYLWEGAEVDEEDKALQAHRGAYKTTALAIGVIRWFIWHPDDRIALVRKTVTDAAEVVTMIGRMMKRPEVIGLWTALGMESPIALVERAGELLYSFKTTNTPEVSITAHGLDGSLTGKHYDVILCDDIITIKDRISKAERERTKEMIRELGTNIVDPGHYIRWNGTPWHRDDGWSVIPARPLRYPVGSTGILTEKQIEDKRKHTTPFLYAANYELTLQTEEGTLFKDPRYSTWEKKYPAYGQLDAAYDGDHTCALTFMARRPDGTIQAIGWTYPGNVKNWYSRIAQLYREYRIKLIFTETNADKGFTADALQAQGLAISSYTEKQNKHTKIATHLYEVWDKVLWDEKTDPEYLEQVMDYRKGSEPDDAPDSAASLVRAKFLGQEASNALYAW